MKILSLFDGMACGYEALVRSGIKIDKYYASEIDKYAIQIALKNHPDIIEIGDVNEIDFSQYDVDMVIGGSPCQDLSIAKANRQGLDGARSGLFRKYVEAIRTIKPKYFLLENVSSMSKDAKEVITKELGVEPILINSALVSGQQRKRLYWTNIPGITQPEDKGIMLKDILESGLSWSDKSVCLTANYSGAYFPHDYLRSQRQMVAEPIRIGQIGNGVKLKELLEINTSEFDKSITEFEEKPGTYEKAERKISIEGKMTTLTTGSNDEIYINLPDGEYVIRKLTPIECERLQTLPDNYTEGVSKTQRYKMLGNGWTVDVIAHIFRFIK